VTTSSAPHQELFARTLAASAIAAALTAGCHHPQRSNVLLISIDCLNQRQFTEAVERGYAPNLLSLKGDSIAFSRAYSHAPWTTPSHMSMLTGLYPTQHGRDVPYGLMIQWNDYYARVPAFSTLADDLGAAGYRTAAFVGQGSISGVYGIDQGFSTFEERRKGVEFSDLVGSVERIAAWLDESDEQPFLLFFHTYDLHGPRPKGLGRYESTIRYIDQYLGRLLLELKTRDLYDDTLILFTGDHGSEMVATEGKCCVHGAGHYEENLRVPLLLKMPRGEEPRDESVLARHVDLLPTVLDALKVDSNYEGPGVSLLERVSGGVPEGEVLSYSEADGRCAARHALVTKRYKYIYTQRDESQALLQANPRFYDETCVEKCRDLPIEELYDLEKDPSENRNLLGGKLDPERAKTLEHLRMEMARFLNLPPHYTKGLVTGPRRSLDESELEELRESLRTLGYIR
jgi:arylsulfatase A-like enzyme